LHGFGWKGGETTAPSEMPSGDYVEQGTTDVTGGERREGRLAMSADGDGDGDGMVAADISTLPKEDS